MVRLMPYQGWCLNFSRKTTLNVHSCRGGLTIWKLGHCPRARGQ
ncbi:unnamed protein product [Staurois parvus]|uniref:Uncharacterized protein n=1 Tax=Staurois parvus TaxID=386267 RepID=A0ABN9GW62_9NEOB|nr:unnamed protein product [Staurois parvus]